MSTPPRLFVESPLSSGQIFQIDEGQSKYILRVMRLGIGASVRVFNGSDGEWICELISIDGRHANLRADTQTRQQSQARQNKLTLLFAPLKKTQTDFVIEKATELGAAIVQPVITQRTQTRKVRLDRFTKIAIEAAEQTERLDVPIVADILPLAHALEKLPSDCKLIFADESGDDADGIWGGTSGRGANMLDALEGQSEDAPYAILIGPEGGFSAQERSLLRARDDTIPVSLGPRILRAETAVVAALTLWQAALGDW